ncbi:hypothetical protein ABN034_14350 [Actinopolymorpha sp. B11F2]|uniref:hypothetical protein n=1 Tax=Actinopolymorpha sp. B11F2 TaxID=3160862 RepID=UPI0032E37FD3
MVIIGGGFAGVWSAAGAALVRGDADLRITLIAPNEHLVLRPRLYEPEPDLAQVELSRILEPIGVEHLRAALGVECRLADRVYIELPFFPREAAVASAA